jgi:hypothetical protein
MRVSDSDVSVPASKAALMSAIVAASNSIVRASAEPSVRSVAIEIATDARRSRAMEPPRDSKRFQTDVVSAFRRT